MEGGDSLMNSIDQKIVQMKFDNSQFENGIRTTLSSLDKLKNSLNLNGATQGIDKLKNSTKGFTVANITDGVDSLSLKFNAFGIAASTVISNVATALQSKLMSGIRNTIGLISSGGMKRAQNLEQARFSMQGLLEQTEKMADGTEKKIYKYGITVEDVMGPDGPVQKSVSGTAYGLDESAKAASNFIASGITDMKDLEQALSSIAGTAAQTGGSFEEISHIYQRVAGQGRVYATDLNSIASRGVNAAMAITEYINSLNGNFEGTSEKFREVAGKLGKTTDFTEQDIREMVSDGAIQFDMFAKSMYNAFGENAYKANETFSGSLSNVKAALSRLGAKFKTPYLERMRDLFNALRPLINSVSKSIDPLINKYNELMKVITSFAIDKIGKVQKYFDDLFNSSNRKNDLREKVEDLNNGLSKTERLALKKQLEEEVTGPLGRLSRSFDNLVAAMKNFGQGFLNIFNPLITQAKNFIGFTTPITLVIENITKKIKSLSEAFKNVTTSTGNMSSWFEINVLQDFKFALQAVMNIINIFIEIVTNAASVISRFFVPVIKTLWLTFSYITRPIIELISNFAEIIRENNLVYLSFKRLSSILSGVFGPVMKWISKTFFTDNESPLSLLKLYDIVTNLSEKFANLANKASDFLEKDKDFSHIGESIVSVFNGIGKVLTPVAGIFSNIAKAVKTLATNLASLLKIGLTDAINGIKSLMKGIGESDVSVVDKVTDVLTKFADIVGKVMKTLTDNLSLGDILKFGIFTRLSTGVAALGLVYDELKVFYKLIKDTKDRVSMLKFGTVKALASSILLIAASLFVLSLIDTVKLASATAVLSLLIQEMKYFYKFMSTLKVGVLKATSIYKLAKSMVPLAASILLLSVALKMLSEIRWDGLLKGTITLGILIGYLALYTKQVSGIDTSKSSASLIALAIAVNILVRAVEKLGEIDTTVLAKGLISVATLLGALGLFTKFSDVGSTGLSSGLAMIALAAAINLLAKAVYSFAFLNPEQLTKGLGTIAALLAEIGAFTTVIDGSKILKASVGVLIISASLIVLSTALQKLASIPVNQLTVSLIAMAASLGIIALAMNLMPTNALMVSAAMIGMATGIVILSSALMSLSTLSLGQLAMGLLAIIGVFAVLGVSAALLQPLVPTIMALSVAMTLFGIGLFAVATAVTMLSATLTVFAAGLSVTAEIILSTFLALMPLLLDGIVTLMPKVLETLGVILDGVLTFIVESIPRIVEAGAQLILGFLQVAVEYAPQIAQAGFDLVLAFLKGISENIQELAEVAADIAINFIDGISNKLPAIIDCGSNLMINFINGLAESIDKNSERMGEAAWNLISALIMGIIKALKGFFSKPVKKISELAKGLIEGFKKKMNAKTLGEAVIKALIGIISGIGSMISKIIGKAVELGGKIFSKLKDMLSIKKFLSVGKDIVQGIINGLGNMAGKAVEKVKNLASDLWSGFKGLLGINSPSTKFMDSGKDIVNGLNDGLKDYSSTTNTVTDMGKSILDKAKEWLNPEKFKPVGNSVTTGIKDGMDSNAPSSKMEDVANAVKGIATRDLKAEQFTKYGKNTTDGIKSGMNKDIPINAMTDTATGIKNAAGSNLKSSDFNKYGSNTTTGIKSGIDKNAPIKAMADAATGIKNTADTNLPKSKFEEIGKRLMEGLKVGIGNNVGIAIKAAREAAKHVNDATYKEAGVNSPSKVFIEIGKYLMLGLSKGISDNEKEPINTITDSVRLLNKSFENSLETDPDLTITPVLDLSQIQNGVSEMNGMLNNNAVANVSANVNGAINSISFMSAFDRLSSLLGGMPGSLIDADEIYDAVREGASNAVFNVMLDGNRITSTVNERNNDALNTRLSFYGG